LNDGSPKNAKRRDIGHRRKESYLNLIPCAVKESEEHSELDMLNSQVSSMRSSFKEEEESKSSLKTLTHGEMSDQIAALFGEKKA